MIEERNFIRVKLAEHQLTQVWLCGELEAKGIITDKTELCSVLKGTRRGAKAENIIKTAVSVIENYEARCQRGC